MGQDKTFLKRKEKNRRGILGIPEKQSPRLGRQRWHKTRKQTANRRISNPNDYWKKSEKKLTRKRDETLSTLPGKRRNSTRRRTRRRKSTKKGAIENKLRKKKVGYMTHGKAGGHAGTTLTPVKKKAHTAKTTSAIKNS